MGQGSKEACAGAREGGMCHGLNDSRTDTDAHHEGDEPSQGAETFTPGFEILDETRELLDL